jgi:two-component system sensor histidine kinase CreC
MVPVIFSLIAITIILYARKKLIKYVIRLAKGEDPDPPKIRLQEFSQIVDAIDNLQSKLKGKKYIETFLSSIAHEVRTPLAGIKANTETLNLSMSSDEFIQSRNNILESNARMALIVDSLLDLAQLEQQNKTLKITKFNAQEAVKNILNNPDIDKKIKDKNIHVKTINLNVFLEGNQALIEMGLSNILNNAIDFSFKDKNISIKAMVIKGNTSIEVLDQGVGIPDNMINRIHNKFVSTPRPDTGRRSTGLGLSIVKIIMDLHNGAFKISNNPEGEGSIATLVFPGQSKHSN